MEEDLTWKDLSGNEALSNLQLVEKLGEGYLSSIGIALAARDSHNHVLAADRQVLWGSLQGARGDGSRSCRQGRPRPCLKASVCPRRQAPSHRTCLQVIKIGLDNEDSFRNEIDILRECRHTNIVPYYGTIYEQDAVWVRRV